MINPARYDEIIRRHGVLFASSPQLQIDVDSITGYVTVKLNIEFVSHPTLGRTKFRIRERFDAGDNLVLYRYCWEFNSKPTGNISAWENEHNHVLVTDPHHHHHVMYDRSPVQESHQVRSLEDAFNVVMHYISTGCQYP